MKAWIVETKSNCEETGIIVFAKTKEAAINFTLEKELLYGYTEELREYVDSSRDTNFDKYYDLFKKEKYIDWNTAKGARAYWEQEWKSNETDECDWCGKSEYEEVPESELFSCYDGDDYEVNICFNCIEYECMEDKIEKEQKHLFEECKKRI